jgi:hypothetical protein
MITGFTSKNKKGFSAYIRQKRYKVENRLVPARI